MDREFFCRTCHEFMLSKPVLNGTREIGLECLECGTINRPYEFDCPTCGEEHDPWDMECVVDRCIYDKDDHGNNPCNKCEYLQPKSETLVELGPSQYDMAASIRFGSCYVWDETHKCSRCGVLYEFGNSSC